MNNKEEFVIVTTKKFKILSNDAIRLCEHFITHLIKSQLKDIRIRINQNSGVIECNDRNIKEILDLYLKSHYFKSFVDQLSYYMHRNVRDQHFVVLADSTGGEIKIEFNTVEEYPNFNWDIQINM